MSFNFTPTYFSLGSGRDTGRSTIAPVAFEQGFYQEEQSPKRCTEISMNTFAGKRVVNSDEYVALSNQALVESNRFQEKDIRDNCQMDVETYLKKVLKMYVESVEDLERLGLFGGTATKRYMEAHLDLFHLPATAQIQIATAKWEIQKGLEDVRIKKLHRVIIEVNVFLTFSHCIAIRKDDAGLWRLLDSITTPHYTGVVDPIHKIQPSFVALEHAIQHALNCYRERFKVEERQVSYTLLYPSVDFSSKALKVSESCGLPGSISKLILAYAKTPKKTCKMCTIS